MNLSAESLQAFAQAAACGSLSAAARRLGKSQSTVSEAVARLELDLGVELFRRGPRRLALTEAGASLLAHAEEGATLAAQAKHEAKRAACGIVVPDAATGRATCSPEPVRCSPCEALAA